MSDYRVDLIDEKSAVWYNNLRRLYSGVFLEAQLKQAQYLVSAIDKNLVEYEGLAVNEIEEFLFAKLEELRTQLALKMVGIDDPEEVRRIGDNSDIVVSILSTSDTGLKSVVRKAYTVLFLFLFLSGAAVGVDYLFYKNEKANFIDKVDRGRIRCELNCDNAFEKLWSKHNE